MLQHASSEVTVTKSEKFLNLKIQSEILGFKQGKGSKDSPVHLHAGEPSSRLAMVEDTSQV